MGSNTRNRRIQKCVGLSQPSSCLSSPESRRLGLLNGLTTLGFTRSVANCLRSAVSEDFPSVKAAEELGIALSDQRGLVSVYIIDEGNPSWLERLRRAEADFDTWLSCARASAYTSGENKILDELEKVYAEYGAKRKKSLLQFDRGERNEAVATLLHEVWPAYDKADHSCKDFIAVNERHVEAAAKRAEEYIAFAAWGVSIGSLGTAGLAVLLLWLVIQGVLIPLRRMLADARVIVDDPSGTAAKPKPADDELRLVGIYFRALMAKVADTRTTLAEARNRMLNAEKLASLGKLAASVAHEMRNPLSSMKMWLYSIRKAAGTEPTLDHKYQILSDEITRLENIVRNVLEFSRPPVLRLQPRCILQVIEKTLDLVRPWLETSNIRVVEHHLAGLPDVLADSEQLKQVLANLLNNAAEAMPEGGEIEISCTVEVDANGSSNVVVRIQDTGHGIPNDAQSRLFEPFFTTKDEGTGLGLCIAANIMARHGGRILLESSTSGGTTFAVWIPIAGERSDEQDSRR